MSVSPDPTDWYSSNAAVTAVYEALDPARVHAWLDGLLPEAPALVLDVAAGTGRDAAWLTRLGYDVVAVEPSAAMRAEGERRHSDTGVRWVADQLPALPATHRLGLAFDLILLSGVWQAGAPADAVAHDAELIAADWWWDARGDLAPDRLVLLVQELRRLCALTADRYALRWDRLERAGRPEEADDARRPFSFADITPWDRCAMAEALHRASHVLHLYG